MTDYAAPVWRCGICGELGHWELTLWWRDGVCRTDIPGGQTVYQPVEPRMAVACSEACGRKFARAVGSDRISITRPQRDDWHRQQSIDWAKKQRQGHPRRVAA